MSAPTPFTETNALLAFMQDDEDAARALIDEMLPGERQALHNAAYKLAQHTSPARYCVYCLGYIADPRDLVSVSMLTSQRTSYHRACREADLAEDARRQATGGAR